jgi:hypothetical protein
MRCRAVLIAAAFAGAAMAQAPAGTLEVEADGCKLYLPQSEARGASRVNWSGGCAEGLAEGRGVVRVYTGERLSLAAERTFSRGVASMIPPDPRPKVPPIQTEIHRQR